MKCPRFLNDRFIRQYKIYIETRGGFPQAPVLVNKEATATEREVYWIQVTFEINMKW